MLTKINVAGFKAIYDSGPIELGPLTLLIGRNGAGKSSLVEAIQWLQECTIFRIGHATRKRFHAFDELVNHRTPRIELGLWFDAGGREVHYSVLVEDGSVQSESCYETGAGGTKQTISTPKGNGGSTVRQVADGRVVHAGEDLALGVASSPRARGAKQLRDWLLRAVFLRLSPTRLAQYSPLERRPDEPILAEDGGNLPALLKELTAKQLREVGARVREVIDGARTVSIHRRKEEPDDAQKEEGTFILGERTEFAGRELTHQVPSWLLSEGTRRLTAIFALLVHSLRPSLLVIEEIENGLDPWTLAIVLQHLRVASASGIQVVLTTHSPYLLDHVEPHEVLVVERVAGDPRFLRAADLPLVKANAGASPTGAMYLAGYLDTRGAGAK